MISRDGNLFFVYRIMKMTLTLCALEINHLLTSSTPALMIVHCESGTDVPWETDVKLVSSWVTLKDLPTLTARATVDTFFPMERIRQ